MADNDALIQKNEPSEFASDEKLFHYTSSIGLYGILSSGCLWASHYSFLNDTKEIHAAKESLRPFLSDLILTRAAALKVNGAVSFNPQSTLKDDAPKEAERHIDILYSAALNTGIPFIFSGFSCSQEELPEIFENGSIRHWQTYGRDGGYALQMSPSALKNLVAEECNKANLSMVYMGITKVAYPAGKKVPKGFADNYAAIARLSESILYKDLNLLPDDDFDKQIDQSFAPILRVISAIKNPYFSDEHEARIVTFRPRRPPEGKIPHEIFVRRSNSVEIPYIQIFDQNLLIGNAIERIIIGPHPENDLRKEALSLFLRSRGLDIDIRVSDVPYITRR